MTSKKIRIVVQAGHVDPREPGFESGTGTAHEQDLARAVRSRLVALLLKDGRFDVVECGGRTPDPRPFKCDAFISLHGDGSGDASASGYCYGYPPGDPSERLARDLSVCYERIPGHPPHRKDNYTRALAGYYGFSARRISADRKVLVEHGFLTNPGEREWLLSHLGDIAAAHYRGICKHFGKRAVALSPKPKPKPKPKPAPKRVDVEFAGRTVNVRQRADNPALLRRIARAILRGLTVVVRPSTRRAP